MDKILLAGATGYLGSFILKELLHYSSEVRVIVRNKNRLQHLIGQSTNMEIIEAELTFPESIKGCCQNIHTVISTVGITKQKDGLTYMDVDYQANLNLLKDAKGSGVKKFIYVSIFNGDKLMKLKICQAKEKFVNALKNSGLDYCVIRPTGYFSDMGEFLQMAKKGRILLFGTGECKMNPVHGADLAKVCVNAVTTHDKEILAGGPEVFMYHQIAEVAFSVVGKTPKINHIPDWVRKFVLSFLRIFTTSKFYGPIEFFMTVLSMDLVAPKYGSHTLEQYFKEEVIQRS